MSKVDAMRALREARYTATAKPAGVPREAATSEVTAPAAKAGGPASAKAVKPPSAKAVKVPVAKPASTPDEGAAEPDRCGHRSMNNRSCTRDAGHAEKNHRYN